MNINIIQIGFRRKSNDLFEFALLVAYAKISGPKSNGRSPDTSLSKIGFEVENNAYLLSWCVCVGGGGVTKVKILTSENRSRQSLFVCSNEL